MGSQGTTCIELRSPLKMMKTIIFVALIAFASGDSFIQLSIDVTEPVFDKCSYALYFDDQKCGNLNKYTGTGSPTEPFEVALPPLDETGCEVNMISAVCSFQSGPSVSCNKSPGPPGGEDYVFKIEGVTDGCTIIQLS